MFIFALKIFHFIAAQMMWDWAQVQYDTMIFESAKNHKYK